jgi:hypothetical protein
LKRDLNRPDSTASRFHSGSNDEMEMEQPHMFPLAFTYLPRYLIRGETTAQVYTTVRGSQLMDDGSHFKHGRRARTSKAQRPCKGLVARLLVCSSICKPHQPSPAIPDLTSSPQCKRPLSATRCPQSRTRCMQQSQEVTWLFRDCFITGGPSKFWNLRALLEYELQSPACRWRSGPQ